MRARVLAQRLLDLEELQWFGAHFECELGAQARHEVRELVLDDLAGSVAPVAPEQEVGDAERLQLVTGLVEAPAHVEVFVRCSEHDSGARKPDDRRIAIAAGTFREDLYFRLNVIELAVPPLVDRPDDILPLAKQFLEASYGTFKLTDDALRALFAHDWPGNVRELQNRLQRAILVCSDGVIRASDLGLVRSAGGRPGVRPLPSIEPGVTAAPANAAAITAETPAGLSVPPPPAAVSGGRSSEREQIQEALSRARGVVSKAAAELGLSRQALYRRMERLGLSIARKVED